MGRRHAFLGVLCKIDGSGKIENDYSKIKGYTVGDSIFLPRQVPHAWTQVSEKGKMTVIVQPAGKLENFFVTMAALDHEPTPKEVAQIFAANEIQVIGPPLKID